MPTAFDLLRNGGPSVVGARSLRGFTRSLEIGEQLFVSDPPHSTHDLTSAAIDSADLDRLLPAAQAKEPERMRGGFVVHEYPVTYHCVR